MTTATMLRGYHGDHALRDRILAQVEEHRQADEIIQGSYWRDGKGCAVGCVLHDPNGGHERCETELGIPVQLAWLEDGIFEALTVEESTLWPGRFLSAIQPGADLTPVWPRFAVWLMSDPTWGVANATDKEDIKAVCLRIADAYGRIADSLEISSEEADSISQAAWAAWAARGAWAAWDARAAWAAWAARDARAAWDAWDAWDACDARAAWAACDARAAWAAWDAFVTASADKLVELLAEASTV